MPNPNYHPDIPREITNALLDRISVYEKQPLDMLTKERIKQSIREYQRELLNAIGYRLDVGVHFSPDGVTLVPLPPKINIFPSLVMSDEAWLQTAPSPTPRFPVVL